MRLTFAALALVLLPLSGCALPRPWTLASFPKPCEGTHEPAGEALLFVTSRLPDCRQQERLATTWYRGHRLTYGSVLDGKVHFHSPTAWSEELDRRLAMRPPLLYIHGYNNDNRAGVNRAIAIGKAMGGKREVIAFTWPSYKNGSKYIWDEANAEWTNDLARRVFADLAGRSRHLTLVAHSMGNRIALDALSNWRARNSQKLPVDRLIMASPDVDRASLVRRLGKGLGVPVTLYGSRRDQPLSASWRTHGYPRAGDLSWWVSGNDHGWPYHGVPGVEVVDTSDVSRGVLRHADFIETDEGAADLCRVVLGMAKVGRRQTASPNMVELI